MEEKKYKYFKRDMSWLSFNYRVLMEAANPALPVYERIHFLSIYSSNLEEFYEVRVSEHHSNIIKNNFIDEGAETSEVRLENITKEVTRQQKEYYRIFYDEIMPALERNNLVLYQTEPSDFHRDFIIHYFNEEVFPFLSPVTILGGIRTFIRDRRLYLVAAMRNKATQEPYYVLIKIPFSKVPRFVRLPEHDGKHYYMFVDDVIRMNLPYIFPGFDIEGCYSIKISRDADVFLDDERTDVVSEVREKVGKRKNGAVMRFMYDASMHRYMLDFLCSMFGITEEDLIMGGRYLNLQDLAKLPNPSGQQEQRLPAVPVRPPKDNGDVLLCCPYHSFDYLLHFLHEAATAPDVEAIKITQYRVAENSAVIHSLIRAAQQGKQVTVFVEVKARFDEVNNMSAAEQMYHAGIKIIYSISGLKVHAKVALVIRRSGNSAVLSTGNFNEETATVYSDMTLFTADSEVTSDVEKLFSLLENQAAPALTPAFSRLLVAQYNMLPEILRMIQREIAHVQQGRRGYMVLKMNGLHDKTMIDELYRASEEGVEIELIIRGICCIVPNQLYSRNIRITRIVDRFLEHARVWYFYNDGKEDIYLTSADWMRRNLSRRIETAVPVLSPDIKKQITDILHVQLRDNVKACTIDENLNNVYKRDDLPPVRAQEEIFRILHSLG